LKIKDPDLKILSSFSPVFWEPHIQKEKGEVGGFVPYFELKNMYLLYSFSE
jgi:hypothetical protein